jgi:hypothetical protein
MSEKGFENYNLSTEIKRALTGKIQNSHRCSELSYTTILRLVSTFKENKNKFKYFLQRDQMVFSRFII